MKKAKKALAIVALIWFGYFLNGAVRIVREFETSWHVDCTLKTGLNSAYFDIITYDFNEVNQLLWYRVRVGEYIQSDRYPFAAVEISRRITEKDFVTITAKDGDLVAISLKEEPHKVLAIYDFTTGETWPNRAHAESFESGRAKGKRLLEFLKESTGNQDLILGDT